MINFSLLQLFLIINIFLAGILTTIGIQHARAHFGKKNQKPERKPAETLRIPAEEREKMLATARAHYETVLSQSMRDLQRDLEGTTAHLHSQLEKVSGEVVSDEMKKYRASLVTLLDHTVTVSNDAQKAVTDHRDELRSKLAEEIAAEKQQLVERIDTKLADAVSSFLVDALGHNVDLGAQTNYLIATLDEHKQELKEGIKDEA